MSWGSLQILVVVTMLVIGVAAHLGIAHTRRAFVRDLSRLARRRMQPFASLSDVISGLLYVGYAAAVLPFDDYHVAASYAVESALDLIGLFALLVAALQLLSIWAIHRVAHHLEPWPPAASSAAAH
jgi:hypothetical protein